MRSKKLLICLVFLFVSLFAFGFNAKVNAATSDLIKVEGAQVRTTGNAGIRFVATEAYEDARSEDGYGILLAFGEAEATEDFVIGGTVNGKAVANAEIATAEDGTFAATLYDIPEVYYTQAISARAYVYADGEYVYSATVTVRSLADVVKAAYADGDRSDFVVNVYEKVADPVLNYGTPEYASFDEFVAEIIADFGASSAATFAKDTSASVKTTFASKENLLKYRWLIELALADIIDWKESGKADAVPGTYDECVEMFNRMLAGDTTAASGSYANARTCFRQFIHTVINKAASGMSNYASYDIYIADYSDASVLAKIAPVYTASETVKLEEGAALPTNLIKNYYTFAGWYDNAEFEGEAVTTHNGANNYYAKFTPTNYTITYHLQDGSTSAELVESYNIATPTFALPTSDTMTIADGSFVGWFDNAAGSGNAITEITLGTVGNIDLYACWEMDTATIVELSANDTAVLSEYTPNLYVLPNASAGKYSINSVEVKFGVAVFSTIADAINAAEDGNIIYVFDGAYTLGMTITKSVTILGPNADLKTSDTRGEEAVITMTAGSLYLNAATIEFNGVKLTGSGTVAGAGVYLQSGANLSNLTIQSSILTHGNTLVKFVNGSAITLKILDSTISEVGQFAIWANGNTELVHIEGCYVDANSSGKTTNTAGALFRIVTGETKVYNNVFEGSLPTSSYGGFFTNRSSGTFEVKYNTFKDVASPIVCHSNDTGKTYVFDCNLYLTNDVAATTSPLASDSAVTADTTVCESETQLAELWVAYKAQ